MNRNRLLLIGLVLGGVLLLLQIVSLATESPAAEAPDVYAARIREARLATDRFMRTDAESPIPVAQRAAFAGLPYFAVDPSYRVLGQLETASTGDSATLTYTRGQDNKLALAGSLQFTLRTRALSLLAYYEDPERTRLFVPFTDSTSGGETYGGGRFLRVERLKGRSTWDVDFNGAYHPYCVFDSLYVCPIPPRENRLPVAVRAGEKLTAIGH
jgi:uncharacterized protein (DUF1684 family)